MTTARQSRKNLSPKAIGAILIAVLALIFVFQNTGYGQVRFLFWTVWAPAWAWLLMIFAAGLIVGSLFPWLRRRGSRG
jgi:uncharacterized integral membrane protein